MELKLKVCGMKFRENIEQVVALKPDYLGLIFYKKSPRFVEDRIDSFEPSLKKTGVFVDASEEFIFEKIRKYDLSVVQLHGNEPPEFCRNLIDRFSAEQRDIELIKVFSIKEEFDFQILEPYEEFVDLFLFDTKGKNKGGNGILFNWELLQDYPSSIPFFLSGGISSGETTAIKELYRTFQKRGKEKLFYGVDVNSKFETSPGMKDIEKLRSFREKLNS